MITVVIELTVILWSRARHPRAMRDAMETDPRRADAVPSTKGSL
ncbi:MAG: hypothetical protein AAFQ04_04860 [Pseudomonadota bacterium]